MNSLSQARVEEILATIKTRKIAVLGDIMLDEFVWGDVTRISPEAPVPVVDVRRESRLLGGAANVLANLVALGTRGFLVGVAGNDEAGRRISSDLKTLGSEYALIFDESRCSTTKTRIVAHNQLVVRADRESRVPISGEVEERVISGIRLALEGADALVVSDYDKGVVTPRVLEAILPEAYARIPVLIDPKIKNLNFYKPATLITPNHHEALRISNTEDDSDSGLQNAATIIQNRLGCDSVLVTRGDRGMMLLEGDSKAAFVKTAAREVYDVTGAGDTVIAALAAALAAGTTMIEAATFANQAAGIVVAKIGTATASAEEISSAFAGQ